MSSQLSAIGIDVGAASVKIVVIDSGGKIIYQMIEDTEPLIEAQVETLLSNTHGLGLDAQSLPVIATGYGRKLVKKAKARCTEIKCHARGIFEIFGHGGTLVDIGGQDSKVVTIGARGNVQNFAMNDKCAAGTGRFLENTAGRLRVPIEEMGQMALEAKTESQISSTCAVFAESEIVSLIARGTPLRPIVRGLHNALVQRIASMVRSVGFVPPVMLSGGVAQNPAIEVLLAEKLLEKVLVPEKPQIMGAYGAALMARGNFKL